MRSLALALTASLAAASLAGCGGIVSVSQTYSAYSGGSAADDLNFAGAQGPVPVLVRGNPFADPGNAGVVAALQRHISLPGVEFRASPAPLNATYWLVLAFGDFMPGVNYCEGRNDFAISEPVPGRTRIAATFCIGNFLRSQALVSGGATASPADPAFDTLTGALVGELFR